MHMYTGNDDNGKCNTMITQPQVNRTIFVSSSQLKGKKIIEACRSFFELVSSTYPVMMRSGTSFSYTVTRIEVCQYKNANVFYL